MNSTELIESCKKVFQECHEERESFEQELLDWITFRQFYKQNIDKENVDYFLSTCKSFHWRSFYNGYLLGATQHLKDEQNTTT